MAASDLSNALAEMRSSASDGQATVMTHLFGIRYAPQLAGWSQSACCELCEAAGAPSSMGKEIHKMIKLAEFVEEKR